MMFQRLWGVFEANSNKKIAVIASKLVTGYMPGLVIVEISNRIEQGSCANIVRKTPQNCEKTSSF